MKVNNKFLFTIFNKKLKIPVSDFTAWRRYIPVNRYGLQRRRPLDSRSVGISL